MKSIIYLLECGSTNDDIKFFLPLSEVAFLSVYTFNQTNGRGQYANKWSSETGRNLSFSMAVPRSQIAFGGLEINFYTALLLSDFISEISGFRPKIKWPNDLILKKKKISGILIEEFKNENDSFYIIGIGINVLQTRFEHLPKAGSLLSQTGLAFDLDALAKNLHEFFSQKLMLYKSKTELLYHYNAQLYGRNEVSVFEIKGVRQNGIIRKVDEDGFLWVELEDGVLHRFFHKEIEMLY